MFKLRNPTRILADIKNLFAKFIIHVERYFQQWGSFVYRHPGWILFCNFFIFACLLYGFFLHEEESDLQKLWVPQDSEAVSDQKTIKDLYTTQIRPEIVYAVSKSETDLLTADSYKEIAQFDSEIQNFVYEEGKNYRNLCYLDENNCEIYNYPLEFFKDLDGSIDHSYFESTEELLSKINSGKGNQATYPPSSTKYISINSMFGGTIPENAKSDSKTGTNQIQQAVALSWIYNLAEDRHTEQFFEKYESLLESFAEEFNKNSKFVNFFLITASGINRESEAAFAKDLQLIFIGIGLIVLYSLVVLGNLNTHQSRMMIAVVGILGTFVSYFEAISLGSYLGIKGNAVVNLVPFMLLGIGVDDMYVLVGSLNAAPENYSPKKKFKYMTRSAGVSITITSLTNICAFAIGSITNLEAIRVFCFYAAIGMLFDFFNQITLFIAAIAYDLRRSENLKGDFCGLMSCAPQSKICCQGKYIFKEDGTPKPGISTVFCEKYYSEILMNKFMRIGVSLVFVGLCIFNVYELTNLKFEFSYEWFIQDSFYIKNAIDIRDRYFENVGFALKVVTQEEDFQAESLQQKLLDLEEKLNLCESCEKEWIIEDSTDSWYKSLNSWVKRGECVVNSQKITLNWEGVIPAQFFDACMIDWVQSAEGSFYNTRLVFDGETLKAAYIESGLVFLQTTEESIQAMNDIRKIADAVPNTFAFNEMFPWYEHYAHFVYESYIQLVSAGSMIFCVILVVLASCTHAVLVLCMVSFTIVGQLALLSLWGEHLNSVTMINSVIGIGIAVDYSAHFAYTFFKNRNENMNNKERVAKALTHVGSNVLSGCFSTFLVILPLSFSQTYIFQTFFKCWLGILMYGLFHSLVVLPVIYSTFKDKEKDKKKHSRMGSSTVLPISSEYKEPEYCDEEDVEKESNKAAEDLQVDNIEN